MTKNCNIADSLIGLAAEDGNQFLTFQLQDEEYGIEILRVQEIKGFSQIAPIPNSPRYIKRVMSLRNAVVPIVDLRAKFNLPELEYNRFTVVIVVTVGPKVMGLVVDAVSDVLNVSANEMEATPDLGKGVDPSFTTGIVKTGKRLITLLNIDKLASSEESIAPTAVA